MNSEALSNQEPEQQEAPALVTPKVGKLGMGYVWELPQFGIQIAIDYLSPKGKEISGEFEIHYNGKFLHTGIHSINSTESRSGLIRALLGLTNGSVPWTKIIPLFCASVLRSERQGEPAKRTHDAPIRPITYLIDNIVQEYKPNLIFGPGGCISGETLIQGPLGSFRADELCESNSQFYVWSLTSEGIIPALAGPVYKKGITDLYEYKFASGRSIIATLDHRFLTSTGWRRGVETSIGETFALSSHELLYSEPYYQLKLLVNDLHYSQTNEDSADRCLMYSHQCDQQLQLALNNGQASFPSRVYVLEHNQPYSYKDDRAASVKCNPSCQQFDRLSRNNYESSLLLLEEQEFHYGQVRSLSLSLNNQSYQLSRSLSYHQSTNHKVHQQKLLPIYLVSGQSSAQLPSSDLLYYDALVSRTLVRRDVFYDLTVPVYENYLANDIWHHNSGKGIIAVATCIAVETKHGIGPFTVKHGTPFYFDWEDDFETFNSRVKRICNGMNIEVPNIAYKRMKGNISDKINEISKEIYNSGATYGVIDSVSACSGTVGRGDTWDSIAHRMFDALDQVVDIHGNPVTWLLIGHVTGDSAMRTGEVAGKMFGSIQALNRARCAWELRSNQQDGSDTVLATLYHAKWNHTGRKMPIGLSLKFSEEEVRIESGTPLRIHTSLADKLEEYFTEHGRASIRALSLALRKNENEITECLNGNPKKFSNVSDNLWNISSPDKETDNSLPW